MVKKRRHHLAKEPSVLRRKGEMDLRVEKREKLSIGQKNILLGHALLRQISPARSPGYSLSEHKNDCTAVKLNGELKGYFWQTDNCV